MSFGHRKRLMEEVEGTPFAPWSDDLDAFILSWEDLNAGGHGTWYRQSVEEGYVDGLTDAYKDIEKMLASHEALGKTSEEQGDDGDEEMDSASPNSNHGMDESA